MSSKNSERTFEYLSGPVSWFEYEFKDDMGNKKMIHLFGDRHDLKTLCSESLKCMKNSNYPKSDCYDFVYFLKELFDIVSYNKQYADFFLEFPYNIYKKDIYQSLQDTMIGKIYSQFKDCFQYTKKNCKYLPYVRMHYTDLRDAFNESLINQGLSSRKMSSFTDLLYELYNDMIEDFGFVYRDSNRGFSMSYEERINRINMIDVLFDMIKNYCQLYQILFQSKNFIEDLTEFIDPFLIFFKNHPNDFNPEDVKYFEQVFELLKKLKHPKSKSSVFEYQLSQLKRDKIMVDGKDMADLIYTFVIMKCMSKIGYYDEFIEKWNDLKVKISKVDKKSLKNLYASFDEFKTKLQAFGIYLDSYLLDGYILTRLFRSFSTSGKKHNPSILSIVYAGDSHIATEVEFFNNFLKLKPIHEIVPNVRYDKKASQCLQSKFFQDIFSYFEEGPVKGKEEYFSEVVNEKNFDFLYQDKKGLLLKPKDLGPFCELLPEIDICSEEEGENILDYYIWIDKDNNKYVFNFKENIYKDESNEILDSKQINSLRKVSSISKLFNDHESELLNPSNPQRRLKKQNNPKLFANILTTYALYVIGGRWKDAEEYILKFPENAVDYALYALRERWPDEMTKDGENLRKKVEDIIRNSKYADKYFKKFGDN